MRSVNQKKAKAARAAAVQAPRQSSKRAQPTFWTSWKGGLVGLAVVALVGASFVVPKLTSDKQTSASQDHSMAGISAGDGPAIGSAPAFNERNVVSGQTISSQTLRGTKTLLFFSEGVMCQACLQQISDIDQVGNEMAKRHIRLVSITPDTPGELKQAIGQYGITSPMISDTDRSMSEAFNALGKGMHADTPGHAFVLIDGRGRVLWQRDYYQPPYGLMYVKPARLLRDIPTG
jgi:peroxiredoxin